MAEGYENTNLIPHNFVEVGDKWGVWTTYPTEETILSYTIPESGLYLFVIQFMFNSNTTNGYTHNIRLNVNGTLIGAYQIQACSVAQRDPICIININFVNAGQIVTVTCYDENPTPINVRLIDLNTSSSYAIKLK